MYTIYTYNNVLSKFSVYSFNTHFQIKGVDLLPFNVGNKKETYKKLYLEFCSLWIRNMDPRKT